jgi:uncharacterized protein
MSLRLISWCCLLIGALSSFAAEVIPPAPKQYFNDYAHVVSAQVADRLNKTLEDFERQTSSQILVVVFPKMESDSSIEDYTVRVAQSWKVGQKGKDNGAVLFVFIQDRKMFLQVGYGLEGALPDVLCHQIIENEIKPRFKAGDYDGGLTAGVQAILAATRGEYKGTGRTVGDGKGQQQGGKAGAIVFIIFFILIFLLSRRGRSGFWSGALTGWALSGGGFSSRGGGGFSGGGGGGGGFSGGGGSFGGGGSGGSW